MITDYGVWLEQIGEAELVGGWAEVALLAELQDRADTANYQVCVTSYDAVLLFVQNRTPRSFEIHTIPGRGLMHRNGSRCGYRVIAPRRAAEPPDVGRPPTPEVARPGT
ncbi:MAG: hypothetical protein IT517_18355 [Burkholderiales bacterium]|nr:hypothetical protein [Burkholderiales bacterium]